MCPATSSSCSHTQNYWVCLHVTVLRTVHRMYEKCLASGTSSCQPPFPLHSCSAVLCPPAPMLSKPLSFCSSSRSPMVHSVSSSLGQDKDISISRGPFKCQWPKAMCPLVPLHRLFPYYPCRTELYEGSWKGPLFICRLSASLL